MERVEKKARNMTPRMAVMSDSPIDVDFDLILSSVITATSSSSPSSLASAILHAQSHSSMPSDTLIPGYTQVENFTNDEDYVQNEDGSVEEEVVYVTLDLGQIEPTLVPSTSSYRLIVRLSPC